MRVSSLRNVNFAFVLCAAITGGCSELTGTGSAFPDDPADLRPVVHLALGDSLTDTLDNGRARHRFALNLAKGDTIDIVIRELGGSGWLATLASPQLRLAQPSAFSLALFAAEPIETTGPYGFVVSGSQTPCFSACVALPRTAAYRVVVRRGAPIFDMGLYNFGPLVRQGSVHDDTLWMRNIGAGRLAANLSSDSTRWLMLLTPTVQASAAPPTAGDTSHDRGRDVSALFRVDGRVLAPGWYRGDLLIDAPGSWERFFGSPETYQAGVTPTVFDSTVSYVATNADVFVVPSLDGQLYTSRGDTVFRLNPGTGVLSLPRIVGGRHEQRRIGPDGAVYVTLGGTFGPAFYPDSSIVRRVATDGSQTVFHGTSASPYAVIPAPDSSIYVLEGFKLLYHYATDGTRTLVSTLPSNAPVFGLVLNAPDRGIYYIVAGAVHRVDLTSGADEVRGQLAPIPGSAVLNSGLLLTADVTGRMYGAVPVGLGGGVLVVSPDGRTSQVVVTGRELNGLTVRGDTLYGAGYRGSGYDAATLWRRLIR